MPRKKGHPHDWSSLNFWLYSVGITYEQIEENFVYSALVDYFPGAKKGSHRVPTSAEIAKERERLGKLIRSFKPDVIVPIGRLSIAHSLGREVSALDKIIGQTFRADPYGLLGKEILIVPLPHPSGASTWKYKKENKELLAKALGLLKKHLV